MAERDDRPTLGSETPDVITCAAQGCGSRSFGVRELNLEEGGQVIGAPHGWGEIVATIVDDGEERTLALFVCSPSCERRLARGLTGSRLGEL